MFLAIDGVSRGLGRGQRIQNRPQSNQRFGNTSAQQKNEDIKSTTTINISNASAFEDEDDDENFAMNKALGIHLILKKILICLNPPNLVQARLVSPFDWFDVATDILIRRRCLRIDFVYSSKIDRFTSIHNLYPSSTKKEEFPEFYDTLHRLTNCIRKSRKFPCVRFGLSGELNKREVKEFFHVYGSQVKELDLDLVFPRDNPRLNPVELANILLFQASNLDQLHIKSVATKRRNGNPLLFDSSTSTSSPVKLPKLKTIIINEGVERDLHVIQDIFNAAVENPGFKCHFDFPSEFSIEHVDLFIQLNKLDTVRILNVSYPQEDSFMEFYHRFANAHHKLSTVRLQTSSRNDFLCRADFREILPKIFDYNRRTLKEIKNQWYLDFWGINPKLPSKHHNYRWFSFDSEMEKDLSDGGKLIQGWDKHKPLLKKILSHLNTSQLLDCRLVNKNWSHEVSSILIERKSIHLHFTFSPQANRFILSRNQEANVELPLDFFVEDLPTLCNLSSNYLYQKLSPSFPCYKISLLTRTSLVERSRELDYLPMNFSYLKGLSELELSFDFGPHTTTEEWKFILDLLYRSRNLKVLTLTNVNNYKSPQSIVLMSLSKLKSYIELGDSYIKNLKVDQFQCKDIYPDEFSIESYQFFLERMGTSSISISVSVSHLEFRPTVKNIDVCEKIAKSSPQLRSINIDLSALYEEGESENWRKVSLFLSKILKSSCETLIKIQGMDQLGFLPGLKLPQFPLIEDEKQLLELRNFKYPKVYQVDGVQDFSVSLLPRGCKFSDSFPFLTSLNINYFPDGAEIDKIHPNLDTASSVKRLTIGQSSSPITPFIFQKIARMFPELEFLSVTVNVEDFYKMSGSIWKKLPKLKELVIVFVIRAELEKKEYFPGLHEAFTGYPEDICNIRKGSPPKNLHKKYPSLTDLQELKSVRIFFEDFSRPEDPWTSCTLTYTFSELTLGSMVVEVKTCHQDNIFKIQRALTWLHETCLISIEKMNTQ